MILKEQNCRIVNQFEEGKFFHTEMLVKPLSISHLIFSSCLHQICNRLDLFLHRHLIRILYIGLDASMPLFSLGQCTNHPAPTNVAILQNIFCSTTATFNGEFIESVPTFPASIQVDRLKDSSVF